MYNTLQKSRMVYESNFNNFPKASIKSLINDNFIESVSVLTIENKNAQVCVVNKTGEKVFINVGRNSTQKISQKNFEKSNLVTSGYIVLISDFPLLTNLRFYITDYLNLNEVFELNQTEKVEMEKQRELIKGILFKSSNTVHNS